MRIRVPFMASIAALVAVASLAAPASSAPLDNSIVGVLNCPGGCGVGSSFGTSRTVDELPFNNDGTTFIDTYFFSLVHPVRITGELFSNDTLPAFDIDALNITLLDAAGTTNFGSFWVPAGNGGVFSTSLVYADLAAGAYKFLIEGFIPDTNVAGQYQLQAQLSAVPLPPAAWMFMSAIIMALVFSWRRRREPIAAAG